MSLFNPSRNEARQFLFDAWAKFKQHLPLSDLEKIAIEVMQMHTEYHALFDFPERYMHQDYFPEMGETNPFLHLSLHISVIEQISINQPTGITQAFDQLMQKHHDKHQAQNIILECLAETLWQAQRNSAPLDSNNYLNLIKQKLL